MPTHRLGLILGLTLFTVQLAFTAAIRGYVVPRLTPSTHWRYGLRIDTDSHFFQQEAERLAALKRAGRVRDLVQASQLPGMVHTEILASLYVLTGSDRPYSAYTLNAVLLAGTGLLLFAWLLQLEIRRELAAVTAGILACSPMTLFAYSELLREPFIVPALLLSVIGLLALFRPAASATAIAWRGWLIGAFLVGAGFVVAATFRPYLMMLLVIALSFAVGLQAVLVLLSRGRGPFHVVQVSIGLALIAVLVFGYLAPTMRGAPQITDASAVSRTPRPTGAGKTESQKPSRPTTMRWLNAHGEWEEVDIDIWRRRLDAIEDKTSITRADMTLPYWCSVDWSNTPWLPRSLDAKLEAIACSREDYLRFCDAWLLGPRADRGCDNTKFDNSVSLLLHLPTAAMFSLLVPYPRLWLDGFASGGTGLRRIGYVIDGIISYILLAGLLLLWRWRRVHPEFIIVALTLVMALTVYGITVPTQFILARLRLSLYIPLLALGAAGWLLRWQTLHTRPTKVAA